jgi:hypothetical protein
VSCATQAIARAFCSHHIESAGKRRLQQSGKHRVNKNDEETFASSMMAKANGPRLAARWHLGKRETLD